MNAPPSRCVHHSTRSFTMTRALRTSPMPTFAVTRLSWGLSLALGLGLASGCVVRSGPPAVGVQATVSSSDNYATAYPTVPPPSPIYEYRPSPPGWGYVWVDGYWDWTGY